MFQVSRGAIQPSPLGFSNTFYVNTYDKYENKDNIQYKPIITFTSQMTGKSVNIVASTYDYANKDRFVKIDFIIKTQGSEGAGFVDLGNKDFPYGFFDVTIRENTSNSLPGVIDTRPVVFTGLMNLSSRETGEAYANPAVTYTEYTTNDSDTESVYITND
tara:strand:+ start:1185 stop:1664 length:480 start_codon:yes stop_codon:yes gene_type:complete